MHRQLTATGVFTLCLVLGAGVLLTAQLHIAGGDEWAGVPAWVLWIGEALAYISAILLWAPGLPISYLLSGMAGLLAFRLAIGTGAALVHSLLRSTTTFAASLTECLTEVLPVGCSVVFAVLAFYPLRSVFSRVSRSARLRQQAANKIASQRISGAVSDNRGGTFLFGAPEVTARQKQQQRHEAPAVEKRQDSTQQPELADHLKDFEVSIPLRVIFPQMPAGVLRPKLAERVLDEGMEVKVPLTIIAPQLKEALIQISVEEMLTYLPKSWIENASVQSEEQVTLPLDVVIPQLPEEVLQLSPASPPAWAAMATEEEEVLFARV
jgi:hypothetical protein